MTPTDHGHAGHRGSLHNPDVAHETSDVAIGPILGLAGILAATAIASAVVVWGAFVLLEHQAEARDPQLSPLAVPATTMPRTTAASPYFGGAQTPQLITNEPAVLRTLRQQEDHALHQYGWVDEKAGIAQIPIDEAKKLLVERGLPSRAGGATAAEGTHAPAFGEASGGRRIPTGEVAPAAAPEGAQPATQGTEPAGAAKPGEAAQPGGAGSTAGTKAGSGS